MGFLDRLRSSQSGAPLSSWKVLNSVEQLEELAEHSYQKPVVIFKHSTSCGISAGAKYRLESDWSFEESDLEMYYLDLLRYRPVSNAVAERFGVTHQSPQIIVLKNGKAVFDTSHHQVNTQAIEAQLG